MKKQYLFFDLDGTLTDSFRGIANSVLYALRSYGIEEENVNSLRRFVGPPLKESFMRFYGFSEEKAEEAVWKYREYFANGGLLENEVYPGIPKLLEKLTKAGYTLAVATSKPEVYTKQILEHFDLEKYFTWVQGSSLDGTLVEKSDVIRKLLLVSGITEKEKVVMIGDRMHDIYGGQSQGIDTIGVLYGFGDRQELEAAGAGQIAETVEDLGRILL